MTKEIQNDFTYFSYNIEKGEMFARDLRDMNNEPSCFNRTKRSLRKAVEKVIAGWHSGTKMYDIIDTMQSCGIRMHAYCAVD
jgi:hypothetical protein